MAGGRSIGMNCSIMRRLRAVGPSIVGRSKAGLLALQDQPNAGPRVSLRQRTPQDIRQRRGGWCRLADYGSAPRAVSHPSRYFTGAKLTAQPNARRTSRGRLPIQVCSTSRQCERHGRRTP